jgi:hypothetical protein
MKAFKALILAMSTASAACAHGVAQTVPSRPVTLSDLTVPNDRLPAGCRLVPSPTVFLGGNRIQGGLWANLPISTNPWVGTDRQTIASIRERVEGPVVVPDGPPPPAPELSRYRLSLADGVNEAYAAIYTQAGSTLPVIVYGFRFSSGRQPFSFSDTIGSDVSNAVRMQIGPITTVIDVNDDACSHAVEGYLKSLG